jgi:2-iminobutanoate/2-iminopropanoate deaminase
MHETRVGMKPEVIYTKSAPKTGFSEGTDSPIAQGVKCGQFLFVSGQGPLDAATKEVVSQDLAEQTRVTLDNVKAVLEAGGTTIDNVVKVGVFLRSMEDFPASNRVFKEYFKGVQPARTTVEAAAPRKGVNVEIDCIAYIPER